MGEKRGGTAREGGGPLWEPRTPGPLLSLLSPVAMPQENGTVNIALPNLRMSLIH